MERINSQTIPSKRRSKRRKQKLVRGLAIVLALMVIWNFFGSAVTWIRQWQSDEVYDVSAENMSVHSEKEKAPKKFSEAQITNELSRLSKKNQTYESIYNNRAKYPTVLLRSLCNNSEMLNFVAGYLTADKSAHGELTKKECEGKIPLLLQWDRRWGYVSYGSSDIGLSGCAPTCLSMVIVGLTGNRNATPDKIA